jgi:hypothetical protein
MSSTQTEAFYQLRTRPVITARQWFRRSIHPWTEDVVDFYRNPTVPGPTPCDKRCGYTMHDHGWIDQGPEGLTVCPGDWIVTDIGTPGVVRVVPRGEFMERYNRWEHALHGC